MNNIELKKIIVREIQRFVTDALRAEPYHFLNTPEGVADNILAKIPDEKVIAEGIVDDKTCEYSGGFMVGNIDICEVMEYKGKPIQLIIRELKNIKGEVI